MPSKTTIVVIDDHPIFRSGLIQLLNLEPSFRILAEGSSVAEAVALTRDLRPAILLLDLSLDGDGLAAIEPALQASPQTRIVVLTASDAAFDVQTALDRGVSGYVLKGSGGAEILDTIALVSAGKTFVTPRAMSRALTATRGTSTEGDAALFKLSPRELTVLGMMGEGQSNREIAVKLGIGEKSVKFHVTNIFAKLEVRNRVEAAVIYQKHAKSTPANNRG